MPRPVPAFEQTIRQVHGLVKITKVSRELFIAGRAWNIDGGT